MYHGFGVGGEKVFHVFIVQLCRQLGSFNIACGRQGLVCVSIKGPRRVWLKTHFRSWGLCDSIPPVKLASVCMSFATMSSDWMWTFPGVTS